MRPALQHDNVTLKINSPVERLETDGMGRRITGEVVKKQDGTEERYIADTVVVAAGAINSALLFLRSANDKHPEGLANRSGLVGCNYMGHNNATLVAISEEPNDANFEKTLAFADYYWGDDGFRHPMGLVQMLGKVDALSMSSQTSEPFEGMTYEEMAAHSLDFWLQAEDLGVPENRVYYETDGKVAFHYHGNNLPAIETLTERLKDLLNHIGCRDGLCPLNRYLGGVK